jgi:hypothetical protein
MDASTTAFQTVKETHKDKTAEENSTPDSRRPPKRSLKSSSWPALSDTEQERLQHVVDCVLVLDYKASKEEEKKSHIPGQQQEEAEKDSILLQLTTAAVKLAQEEDARATTALVDQPPPFLSSNNFDRDDDDDDDDDNTANVIQRLLQAAKRNEAINVAQEEYLKRAQLLFSNDTNHSVLLHPLEVYLKNRKKTSSSMSTISFLLGQCEPSETLQCLWDAVEAMMEGGEDNTSTLVYRLIITCFHLAAAHAFLSCRDDDDDEKKTQTMGLLQGLVASTNNSDVLPKDAAIQAVCQSFVEFLDQKKKTLKDNNCIDHHSGRRPSWEHFMEWHNYHVPGLLSALPLFMHALLFPSFGDDDDDDDAKTSYGSLPALDKDKGSVNMLFSSSSSTPSFSSWLFVIASTIPVVYGNKVGPTVRAS